MTHATRGPGYARAPRNRVGSSHAPTQHPSAASRRRPETLGQARARELVKRAYLDAGLCHRCAAQAAWGHQCGFTLAERPCPGCEAAVADLPEAAAGGAWRRFRDPRRESLKDQISP